jgi:hypothetical protein
MKWFILHNRSVRHNVGHGDNRLLRHAGLCLLAKNEPGPADNFPIHHAPMRLSYADKSRARLEYR